MANSETIRLVVAPGSAGKFTARLESTGEVVVTGTRQPLVDGARELLARGFDPATLLTMRHEGKAYDSFQPLPIGKWAGWTYEERDRGGLRCVRLEAPPSSVPPEPTLRGRKSGSEPSEVPEGHQTENRFHGGAPQQPQPTGLLGAA